MTDMDLFDIIGLMGVATSISCYARVQWHRDFAKSIFYSVGNLFGAALIGVSLWHKWNMAAFVCNAFWALISVYGMYRCLKYSRQYEAGAVQPSMEV
ncbi:MAG: hypothetical protein PHX43_08075 [Alphaproteobacteria bacterium]|nr:hypothetical protein [Alphaproteobacteria bacterium]